MTGGERHVISAVNARETMLWPEPEPWRCRSAAVPLGRFCTSATRGCERGVRRKGRAPPQAQYEISVEPPSAPRLVRSAQGKAP